MLTTELAAAARVRREAMRDRTYRGTPMGLEVGHFLRWFRNEYGAQASSVNKYEGVLSKFVLDHADLELKDFEPPVGTQRVREFLDDHWGASSHRTRRVNRAILKSFFDWAQREFKILGNPVVAIRPPKIRDVPRDVFDASHVHDMIAACPTARDRAAVRLLFELGLRKGELRMLRFKDIDLARRRIRVHGKGGTVRHMPIPSEELRQELAAIKIADRPSPDEHLLHPVKTGMVGGSMKVIWRDETSPLGNTALHNWWQQRVADARVPYLSMHHARHTCVTDFLRRTGNLKLAQQLARHATIATTADIYGHLDDSDLADALEAIHGT